MENKALWQAKAYLEQHDVTCVLIKEQDILESREKGIRPLMGFLDSGTDFTGYTAGDRIVGKAAAFLYLSLGVEAVYAVLMTETAKQLLEQAGVAVLADTLTDCIINRKGDGPCPMEKTVWDVSDRETGVLLLRRKLSELSGK